MIIAIIIPLKSGEIIIILQLLLCLWIIVFSHYIREHKEFNGAITMNDVYAMVKKKTDNDMFKKYIDYC